MTQRLYYDDSYIKSFNATVISCMPYDDIYAVILDKTAFFPEGGGQPADTGLIGPVIVSDVQIINGDIVHYVSAPLEIGKGYDCCIDWDLRYSRMQNHSGEHIFSGIAHSMFGCDNVGFHMSSDTVTIDLNVELSSDELSSIELAANKAVYDNVPIRTYFPSSDELDSISYRSKLELTEDLRIVEIGKYDTCACCAPHVARSGDIGIIKITSSMRHRGGTRITILCGIDAYNDYSAKHKSNTEISALLSARSSETPIAVKRMLNEIESLKKTIFSLKNDIISAHLQSISNIDRKYIYVFCPSLDSDSMRELVNRVVESRLVTCAAFSGNDESGYKYIIGSRCSDMKAFSVQLNSALHGRGGGKSMMIQGSVNASKDKIKGFFDALE